MRKFYHEFFYIAKHEKIRDKVMIMRVAVMAMIIVFCLAAMSITAYAYFSCEVVSGSNLIKAVTFETTVEISDENGQEVDIIPVTSDYRSYLLGGLEVGKIYNISIKLTDTSSAETGFVVLTADGCDKSYHTQQLYINPNSEKGEVSQLDFKLMITDNTNVILTAHWGTSSYFDGFKNNGENEELYITLGEEIKVIVNGIVDPVVNIIEEENSDSNIVEESVVSEDENSTDLTQEEVITNELEEEQSELSDDSLEKNNVTE